MIGVPEITLIVPHAMSTISVEADLCITTSAERDGRSGGVMIALAL